MSLTNIQVGSQTVSATVSGVSGTEYAVSLGSQTHTALSHGDTFSFDNLEPGSTYDIDIYEVQDVPLTKSITILVNSVNALHVAELEAYTADGVNVARSGKATQSSTSYGAVAQRGIDGDNSGLFGRLGVTHTRKHTGVKWWKVELDKPYPVKTIKVYNRRDCCNSRLKGALLIVRDSSGKDLKVKTLTGSTRVQVLTMF